MEKPQYYDLIIDLTSFSPERASRPELQLSVRVSNGRSRKPSHRLSTIRFTWSDVKLVCRPILYKPHPRSDKNDIIHSGTSSTASYNSTQPPTASHVRLPLFGQTPGACTKTSVWPARGSGPVAMRGVATMARPRLTTNPMLTIQMLTALCTCARGAKASRVGP